MPLWFFLLLALVVVVAVVFAISVGFRRSAGGQNTTIVERGRGSDPSTTVIERD